MSLLSVLRFITAHPLNRDRKLEAIHRFAKWQLGTRLIAGAVVVDWVNGSRFLLRRGETGLSGNLYTGLHEFSDMGFLLHALRSSDVFVDVGANVGSYTILACAAIGARCYAFEPVPGTYARLLENVHLNGVQDRATCLNVAVGAHAGRVACTSDSDTMNHVIAASESCQQIVQVDVTTLDAALADESPTILKIDVEGYEAAVLEGAHRTLARPSLQAIIMELNGSGQRYGVDESQIPQTLFDHGFQAYVYNPLQRVLTNLERRTFSAGNTLFIRDVALVSARLQSAPRVSVLGKQF